MTPVEVRCPDCAELVSCGPAEVVVLATWVKPVLVCWCLQFWCPGCGRLALQRPVVKGEPALWRQAGAAVLPISFDVELLDPRRHKRMPELTAFEVVSWAEAMDGESTVDEPGWLEVALAQLVERDGSGR